MMSDLIFHVYDKKDNVIVHSLTATELEEKIKNQIDKTDKHDVVPVWEPSSDLEPSY